MTGKRASRRPAREAGNTFVIVAFAMSGLLVVFSVLVDLVQLHQARMAIDTAVQAAAVDGARMGLDASTLPPCPGGRSCPPPVRHLAITDSEAVRARVRTRLTEDLESVAYLMVGTTPKEVAAQAQIAVISPPGNSCRTNPFDDSDICYYDPFVAVSVAVPLQVLWGATQVTYRVSLVGAVTDNPMSQLPATPIPTSTPAPIPTWPVPRPTCEPSRCQDTR